MGLIEDINKFGIDLSKLPYDCPARASERIRKSYWEKGVINAEDLDIVLGDISVGISVFEKGVREVLG